MSSTGRLLFPSLDLDYSNSRALISHSFRFLLCLVSPLASSAMALFAMFTVHQLCCELWVLCGKLLWPWLAKTQSTRHAPDILSPCCGKLQLHPVGSQPAPSCCKPDATYILRLDSQSSGPVRMLPELFFGIAIA